MAETKDIPVAEILPGTVDYASPRDKKPVTPERSLWSAAALALVVLFFALLVGLQREHAHGLLLLTLMVGLPFICLPAFCIAFVCWCIGLTHLRNLPPEAHTPRWKKLAAAPIVMAMVALLFVTGVLIPDPASPPGVSSFEQNVIAWNDAADSLQDDSRPTSDAVDRVQIDIVATVAIRGISTDTSDGVWFVTRQRGAGGWMWDYWYDGLVRNPGPDPIGNRNQLKLTPLGNGWYEFSTRWTD